VALDGRDDGRIKPNSNVETEIASVRSAKSNRLDATLMNAGEQAVRCPDRIVRHSNRPCKYVR
jgi:hypothetical protein